MLRTADVPLSIQEVEHPDFLPGLREAPGTVLFLDVDMPAVARRPSLFNFRGCLGRFRVVALSDDASEGQQARMLGLGAARFLWKSVDQETLQRVIERLLQEEGETPEATPIALPSATGSALLRLSRQQQRIASMASVGMRNKQIAGELGIALNTVKVHMNAILRTLGIRNRTELATLLVHVSGTSALLAPDA